MKSDDYCEYCKHNTYTVENWSFCKHCGECHNGEDVEMNFEGIEVIPVEQVKYMLENCSKGIAPCNHDIHFELCKSGICEYGDFNISRCWLQAYKEGWLNEK